ncbi:hypothetical protein ACO0QE_002112 [Hanseniaspora vineae]
MKPGVAYILRRAPKLRACAHICVPFRSKLFFSKARYATTTHPINKTEIQQVFDNDKYWKQIKEQQTRGSTGLFENQYVTSPEGLLDFSKHCLKLAQDLVDKMHKDHTHKGLRDYIRRMDELSNILCRVIDLSELIRSSHPDMKFVEAAQKVHEKMFEFMNILNTDLDLCNTLKAVLQKEHPVYAELSDEEIKVGTILLQDFEKSGNFMGNEKIKESFIQLSQQISVVGQDFINNTDYAASNYVKINCAKLDNSGTPAAILKMLPKDLTHKNYKIPVDSHCAYSLLRACPDASIRKQIWCSLHSCDKKQIQRLRLLLQLRSLLATTMDSPNFASYQLAGKLAKNPQNVLDFLNSLCINLKGKAEIELRNLQLKTSKFSTDQTPAEDLSHDLMKPWDKDYYATLDSIQSKKLYSDGIEKYFSLGNVMQGLSDLFSAIYKVKFVPVAPQKGETWNEEVRRLNVVDESNNDNVIGVIYCDLFERWGKTSNPAHFTVSCSRRIFENETFSPALTQIGKETSPTTGETHDYQLPVIALICNFPNVVKKATGKQISLLQLSDVETIFHEMGHAIHSMLGRTELQNVSGTRCTTDFVELPSILMEHFAKDPRVLSHIGKHYSTGEKIDTHLLQKIFEHNSSFEYTEAFQQLKMAYLDQHLHNLNMVDPKNENIDIVDEYHKIEKQFGILVDDSSNWVGKFGHLFGYGALYYSYLLDRAIASKVFHHLFKNDPFSSNAGEKFKQSVLKWGGAKDPWECLALCFDKPELSKGDEEAMKFIGEIKQDI